MAKKCCLFLFVLLTCFLSYVLYKPLPSSIEEPWTVRTYVLTMESALTAAKFGERLGFGSWMENYRSVLEFIASALDSRTIPESLTATDSVFDGVPVRIYSPVGSKDRKKTGAIVYYHGGGWTFCSIDFYHRLTIALAVKTGIPVISVGYRLSPEFGYPIPLDDCVAATKHLFKHAKDFNVDPKRIVIAGDSAGGNLAAAVALRLKSQKPQTLPVAQVLIYPVLQAFDFKLPSHLQNDLYVTTEALADITLKYLGLDDEDLVPALMANNHTTAATKAKYANVFDVTSILPEKYQSSEYRKPVHEGSPDVVRRVQDKVLDPFFSPLVAPDELVRGLPSAYILTAGQDALRDDGFLYAHRLRKQGVDVKHVDYPGGYHPFLMQIDGPLALQLADQALDDIAKYVKQKVKAS